MRFILTLSILVVMPWPSYVLAQDGKDTVSLDSAVVASSESKPLVLSDEDLANMKKVVLKKVTELTKYISTIGNKEKDDDLRTDAIDQAIDLFLDEERIVQVSSTKRKDTKSFPVRKYFNRLMQLPYYKVKISFYEVVHVSDLEKMPDGTYVGTAYMSQSFEAYNEGNIKVYSDKTVKKVRVVVRELVHLVGDEEVKTIAVMLGNIEVQETKK